MMQLHYIDGINEFEGPLPPEASKLPCLHGCGREVVKGDKSTGRYYHQTKLAEGMYFGNKPIQQHNVSQQVFAVCTHCGIRYKYH